MIFLFSYDVELQQNWIEPRLSMLFLITFLKYKKKQKEIKH